MRHLEILKTYILEKIDVHYTYDKVGNRRQCQYNHLSPVVYDKYYYDTLNRLWKVEYAQTTPFSYLTGELPWSMEQMVLLASAWLDTDIVHYADIVYRNRFRDIHP